MGGHIKEIIVAQANIQIYVDNVLVSDVVAMRQKVQVFLDAEPDSQLRRFMYDGVSEKVNVTLLVNNVTMVGLQAIHTKIDNYLNSQLNSHLTLFAYTED